MTSEEQDIWRAAYAAAFVGELRRTWHYRDRHRIYPALDGAIEHSSAELPIHIADLAVQRLREWRQEENLNAGSVIQLTKPLPGGV